MKTRDASIRCFFVSSILLSSGVLLDTDALGQVQGTGQACRYQFLTNARNTGSITTTYVRSSGASQAALVNVDGTVGAGNPTSTAEMAAQMCAVTASLKLPGVTGQTLNCTTPFAGTTGKCCVESFDISLPKVDRWSIFCQSSNPLKQIGVQLADLGGATSCLPLAPGEPVDGARLLALDNSLRPVLEFSGVPKEDATIRIQASAGATHGDIVEVPIDPRDLILTPDPNADPGTLQHDLEVIAGKVTAKLLELGYGAENLLTAPSDKLGGRSAFIQLVSVPAAQTPDTIDLLAFNLNNPEPVDGASPPLGYGVEFALGPSPVPGLSPWALLALSLCLPLAGGIFLSRRRRQAVQEG